MDIINDRFVHLKPQKEKSHVLWSHDTPYEVVQHSEDKSEQWKGDFKTKKSSTPEPTFHDYNLYASTIETLSVESNKLSELYLEKSINDHKKQTLEKQIKKPVGNHIHIILPIAIGLVTLSCIYLIFKYRI